MEKAKKSKTQTVAGAEESVGAGRRVSVFRIDPGSGKRLDLLATATVGEGGWVDLPEPITVGAREAFVAVPEQAG